MNLTQFKQSNISEGQHYMVLGKPISHSFSPLMHNTALSHYDLKEKYFAIELQENELTDLAVHLNQGDFRGANITLPYKQSIIDYLDGLDVTAKKIEAVNTIVKEDNKLVGYNTDIYGFAAPLAEYRDELEGRRAIVFGTGGASRAIISALLDFKMDEIILISRNPDTSEIVKSKDNVYVEGYDAWASLAVDAELIVNATPVGMYPNVNDSPIRESEKQFLGDCICYDIVYNPLKTTFLNMAEEVGSIAIGGLEMLIHQGSRSFELWTGRPFPVAKIRQKLYEEIDS